VSNQPTKGLFGENISNWTPAELQAFIQNVGQLEPSQLPSSYSSDQVSANGIVIAKSLSLATGAQLLQDGYQYPSIAVPASSFTGDIVPIYIDHSGIAAARAGGSSVLAATSDITDASDTTAMTSGRANFSRIYLPARTPVSAIHLFQGIVPTTSSYTAGGVALYQMTSMGASLPNLSRVTNFNFSGSSVYGQWNAAASTGFRDYTASSPVVLDPGIYYGAFFLAWSALTGSVSAVGTQVPDQQMHESFLGGAPATLRISSVTSLASTYAPADYDATPSTLNRLWFALS